MNPHEKLRTTEYALLGVLAQGGPMSGYDAKAYIDMSISQFWGESFGQIYPALESLQKSKLVRSRADKNSARERKIFEITSAGREALSAWLTIAPEVERPRSEIILKTFLGEHAPQGAIAEHLRSLAEQMEQRVEHLEKIAEQILTSDAGSPALPFATASIRAGIHISRARAAWARETVQLIESSSGKNKPKR